MNLCVSRAARLGCGGRLEAKEGAERAEAPGGGAQGRGAGPIKPGPAGHRFPAGLAAPGNAPEPLAWRLRGFLQNDTDSPGLRSD